MSGLKVVLSQLLVISVSAQRQRSGASAVTCLNVVGMCTWQLTAHEEEALLQPVACVGMKMLWCKKAFPVLPFMTPPRDRGIDRFQSL